MHLRGTSLGAIGVLQRTVSLFSFGVLIRDINLYLSFHWRAIPPKLQKTLGILILIHISKIASHCIGRRQRPAMARLEWLKSYQSFVFDVGSIGTLDDCLW